MSDWPTNARVISVVVTHNRAEMLKQVVAGLRAQTHQLAQIIVVDMASQPAIEPFSGTKHVRVTENLGGAAGFHVGMRTALQSDCDWIWVMDDDVVPDANCLAQLLAVAHNEQSACIHPRKRYSDATWMDWSGWLDTTSGRLRLWQDTLFTAATHHSSIEVNYACFEGMLIHRELVQQVGLPRSLYFISYDDVAYGARLAQQTRILYARDAHMTKLIDARGQTKPSSMYYRMRNLLLLQDDLSRLGTLRPEKALLFWLEEYLRLSWAALKVGEPRWATLWYVQRGAWDAVRGKFGR